MLPKSFLAPYYLGEIFIDKKNYADGIKLIVKGNNRSKGSYRHILYKLGQVYMEMKEFGQAVIVFEKIVKLDAQFKDVQTLLKQARKQI